MSTYSILFLIACIAAISLQLYLSTSLLAKAVTIYKTVKVLRVLIWSLLIGFLCYLIFALAGAQVFSILLLLIPEYISLTIAAIITFFILLYVLSKNEYDILNVFGSVLLIIWVTCFVLGTFIHLGIHFQLLDKTRHLLVYLNRELPGNYKVLPYFLMVGWIINFFALLYVTGRRISNILTDYITQKVRSSYQEKIIELINEDADENGFTVDEQNYLKKVKRLFFTRQIFSGELLRMHELVYGSLHDQIHRLFYSLSLTEDAFYYLHSRHWFFKIKGLRIYAELGDRSEIAYIQGLIMSENPVLRFEAQLALTRLSEDEKPLDYLKDLELPLTVWEQLNLIHFYTNHKKPVGNLSGLLESKNTSVIYFALQCIRKFNRIEYKSKIVELTRHPDLNVKNVSFQTLSLYEEPEIVSYLLSCYDNSMVLSTKISIIRSLSRIGNMEAFTFLKEQIDTMENDEICIELFRALIHIDSQQASDLAKSDYLRFMRLYEHVTETSI